MKSASAAPGVGDRLKYLQITGVSHSGTTLLAFLLNAHRSMVSVGEMSPAPHVDLPAFQCSCGEPFQACPFMGELQRRVQAEVPGFELSDWGTRFVPSGNRYVKKLLVGSLFGTRAEELRDSLVSKIGPIRTDLEDRVSRIEAVAKSAVAMADAEVFVDTTKNPRRAAYLSKSEALDLHVVHVIKDVRQGVASSMKRERGTPAETAKAWQRGNLAAGRAARHVAADRFMTLHYHEFAADPQGTIDRISSFVGVPTSVIPDDFFLTEHHIIGNHMRLNKSGGVIRNDTSWRDRLGPEDLATIARVAGETNANFGFDWPAAK